MTITTPAQAPTKIFAIMRERGPAPYSNEDFTPYWEVETLHRSIEGCAKFFTERAAVHDQVDRHHEHRFGPGETDAASLVIGTEYSLYRRAKGAGAENFVTTGGYGDTFRS